MMASGLIANNKFKNNGYIGISVNKYTDGVTVENNEVTGANLDQDGAGIYMTHWGKPQYCKNHIIRNNKVEKNIRGIVVYYASYCTIEGNKFKTDSGSFPQGQGAIKLDNAHHIDVKDNDIKGGDGTGITVQSYDPAHNSSANTFTGNKIKNAKFAGVLIYGPHARDNIFEYNTIKGTKWLTLWAGSDWEETQADGVFIDDDAGTGNVFHDNNIYHNDDDGMENQLLGTTVDAECNWWGHYSGPDDGIGAGLGDAVNGDIYFDPWLALPFGLEFEIYEAKIDFKEVGADDEVHVKGLLKTICYNSAVTISDDVIVTMESDGPPIFLTIPGDTMEERGKEGEKWEYKRPKGGTGDIKHIKIDWKKGKFDVHMDKADLSGLINPDNVTVTITIGSYDFGSETITMTVTDSKWEYKAPK